jgi:hypothetical protein
LIRLWGEEMMLAKNTWKRGRDKMRETDEEQLDNKS